ncbi:MAG: hypothetical protein ABIP71_09010, partial [Verrucomicrobiota bacterium]
VMGFITTPAKAAWAVSALCRLKAELQTGVFKQALSGGWREGRGFSASGRCSSRSAIVVARRDLQT